MQSIAMIQFGSVLGLVGYIGPGPGLSMLGALVGLIVTVVAALGAVLLWPIRALLGTLDDEEGDDEGEDESQADDEEDDQEAQTDAEETEDEDDEETQTDAEETEDVDEQKDGPSDAESDDDEKS